MNLDLEQAASPYQEELDEVAARINEINKEIENFLDAVGKSGSKVISLLEKKVEKLQDDLKELEKRKGELIELIAGSPQKVSAQIVLNTLRDFSELYDTLRPTERAVYLQRILRDVMVYEDKVTINIYGLRKPPPGVSKKRTDWLPGTDSNRRLSGYKGPDISTRLGLSHHPSQMFGVWVSGASPGGFRSTSRSSSLCTFPE